MTESVLSTQLTNTAPSCPFTWWACEAPADDFSSLEDDSLPIVNPVPNAPGVQDPEQVLTREESLAFVREVLGYGIVSKYSFSQFGDKQGEIWKKLLAAGYVDERTGNIQKKLYADLPVSFSSAEPKESDFELATSAFSLNIELTQQEKINILKILRMALPPIYDNYLDTLISNANKIANAVSSSQITRLTAVKILSNPNSLLWDTVRLDFQFTLNFNDFIRTPLADMDTTGLEELASQMAATGILDQAQLQVLREGKFDLKVVSATNERGEVDGYRVILEIGYYNDTVAEFRNGEITRGGPDNPSSPVARGVIIYLQRLLAANGYLSYDQYLEGIFNLQTLNALQTFMSNKNLTASFHAPTTAAILAQKVREAQEAYDKYQAALGGDALSRRYMRYELAKEALNKISMAVEFAERYRDIPSDNLTEEERTFRDQCIAAATYWKAKAHEIFEAIYPPQNPASGLISIDINTLKARMEDLEKAKGRSNHRKEREELNRVIETTFGIVNNLRRWEKLAEFDAALHQQIESDIQNLTSFLRSNYVNAFPEEARHVQEALSLIDQGVLAEIDGEGVPTTSTPGDLRLQYYRASQISDALTIPDPHDPSKVLPHPARALMLSFIRGSLQDKSVTKLNELLTAFGRLVRSQGGNLEAAARYYLNQMIRESVEGRSGGELSWGMANTMDYLNASLSSYSDTMRNQLLGLARSLYSLMQQYNTYAAANGLSSLSFTDMMQAATLVTDRIQDLSNENAKKTLEILGSLSDSPTVAEQELAQMYEDALDKLSLSDYRRLKGSSNILIVSPKALHELEKGVSTNQAINGAVAYEDLTRWGKNNAWVDAHMPANAQPGEFFYVSSMGIQRVPADQLANVEKISPNHLAGTEYERNPIEFIHNERIAALKLAMARSVPISDKQVLMLSGMVTARLMATDLEGVAKVFGEGTHWIIRPGSLSLLPLESSALKKAAGTLESQGNPIADLLRRVASGETRFTKQQKDDLENFLKDLNGTEFAGRFAILDAAEREALAKAIVKIKFAVSRMHHKSGLSTEQKEILNKLANYLGEDLSINDARLVHEEPASELIGKLRARPNFNEAEFRTLYAQAIRILLDVHGQLAVLASKYPPEDKGWEGHWTSYLPLLLLNSQHRERTLEAMLETIKSPSQADYLMAGVANDQVFEMNIILSPELVNRLVSVNAELEGLESSLRVTDELLANNVLAKKVKDCQAYAASLTAVLNELRDIRDGKNGNTALREGNQIDDTLRDKINSFEQLVQQLQNSYNTSPSNYIVGAEGLLEQIQTMLVQLENIRQNEIDAINRPNAEEGAGQRAKHERSRDTLTKIINALKGTEEPLTAVIAERNQVIPNYQKKFELEVERQDIIDQLSSDRFDNKKFTTLSQMFSGVLGEQSLDASVLDYVSSIFSGDNGEILDQRGQNTRKTIGQILTEFFDNHPNADFSLANLLPEPGEDAEVTLAKIALSKFFEKLPREQVLDYLKTIPSMVGLQGLAQALPAIGSRAVGGVTSTFGPQNPQELPTAYNNPAWRLQNAFLSFMALSSDQQPRMNLSSQVYMMLAGTIAGQEHLTKMLAGSNPRFFAFDKVDQETMKAFLDYFKKEVFPHLSNPRLMQRIAYLEKTNKIPLSLKELADFNTWETLIKRIPNGDFQLLDSFHTPAGDRNRLAKFVETVMKVVGEINQAQAVEDVENYSITYFDPLATLKEICPQYRELNAEPPREVTTIRYGADPGIGDTEPATELAGIPLEQLYEDAGDWIGLYGDKALDGIYDQMTGDFGQFIWEAAKGSGAFAANFGLFMGKQIGMGFADSFGGLGDLLSALRSGDTDKALTALKRVYDGLAQTTGSFVMFETLPFLFYSDVLSEIEAGNYSKAFGKAVAITAMTFRSLKATVDVVGGLIRGGQAYWHGGKLLIKDTEAARRMFEQRMAQSRSRIGGRTGLKLLWYQLNPFALSTKLYQGVRYAWGNLQVEVARSPVEIRLASAHTDAHDPSTWTKIADATAPLRTYRYGPGKLFKGIVTGFGLPGRAASLLTSRSGQMNLSTDLRTLGVDGIPGDLYLARTRLGTNFILKFSKWRTRWSGTDNNLGQITVSGETYLKLVQARAKGEFGTFWRIIRRCGGSYSAGSIRQLYHTFKAAGEAYNNPGIREFLDGLPAVENGGINPYEFLQKATVGRGLGNTYEITVTEMDPQTGTERINPATGEPVTRTQTVTGRQIVEILYNRYIKPSGQFVIDPEIDAHIASAFESSVDGLDLHKMVNKIGKRYVERFWRHKYADSLYLLQKNTPGWFRRRNLFRFLNGAFGRPAIASAAEMESLLGDNPMVQEYASLKKLPPQTARKLLAQELFQKYVLQRTERMRQILDKGAHAKGCLSEGELALYERQGNSLRRGLLPGSRQYQKVLKFIKNSKLQELQKELQKLADFDSNFNVNTETENILKLAQMPGQTPRFNLEMEFLQAGIRTNVMDFNKAFEGVDESIQRQFLEAAKKAGVKRIVIEDGVNFGNGGEESLRSIISDMEQSKLPKKFKLFARDGNIHIKGRLRLSTSTTSMNGAGAIERAPDIRVGGNGLASAEIDTAVNREFTVEELSQAHELLQKMGFSEAEARSIATKEAFLEKVGQKFGERLPSYLQELQRTDPNKYTEILQKMIRPSMAKRAAVTGIGAAVNILSYFPLEALLDVLGVQNESVRFASLILGGMGVNAATAPLVNRLILGKTAVAIERGLSNVSWASKIGVGGVNLLAGLGYAGIATDIWVKILDDFGVGPNSALRKELAMFLVGSGAPMAIELGGGAALNGMNALATRMGFQTVAGATVGRAMWVLGLARVGSDMTQWFFDDYEESVNDRARDYQRLQLARGGTGDKVLLFIDCFFDPILGSFQDATTAIVDDGSRAHIAEEDAEQIAAWQPRVLNTLFSAWMADSGQDMFSYDGTVAPDLAFFQNPQMPSMEKLSEIVNQDIEFTNHQPVLGTYNITLDDEEVAGNAGGTQTVHVYGEMVREADAYQYIMNNPNVEQDKLVETLKNEYNIQDVEGFLQKVSMKNLREQIKSIISMRPDEIDSSTLSIADNRQLRQIFDSETGKMVGGQETQLATLLMQGENGKMLQAVAEFRKVQRLQALLTGRSTATDVDIQLGLVKADGSIDENSATYTLLEQTIA
jgi:peptidoglycan hydrolase-like protein with peptidoglycan-binding domain